MRWLAQLLLVVCGWACCWAGATLAAEPGSDGATAAREGGARQDVRRTPPDRGTALAANSKGSTVAGRASESASGEYKPIPLAPPRRDKSVRKDRQPPSAAQSLTTVVSSLSIVLGVFGLVVWMTRKALPNPSSVLPKEAVQLLGRAPLGGRQQMHLVRIGNKLVLLSVTPAGVEPLTEITDPLEVDRLCGLCAASQPGSISATFRDVLNQFGNEAPPAEAARTRSMPSQQPLSQLPSQLSPTATPTASQLRASRRRTAESERV